MRPTLAEGLWREASPGARGCQEDAVGGACTRVIMYTMVRGTGSENRDLWFYFHLVSFSHQDSAQTGPAPGAPHCPPWH